MNIIKRLNLEEVEILKIKVKKKTTASNPQYYISKLQWQQIEKFRNSFKIQTKTETKTNDYKKKFVLSAWNMKTGQMMDINTYCSHYSLPREDIHSYKLVSHTGTPYYNIAFKENILESGIDFDAVLSKYAEFSSENKTYSSKIAAGLKFDMVTYTDVHIGMDTDKTGSAMYADDWSAKSISSSFDAMVSGVLREKQNEVLIVDELGDYLDGFNGYTTRGGHKLPQLMTDEQAFDLALELKINSAGVWSRNYKKVIFNNICNDNHAGAFGYFVNSAFKKYCDKNFNNVEVTNHRKFINHYFVNNICFIITHGKDDSTLKFGFKPQLDSKGLEKIDQYCKQNDLYKKAKKIVFKKGDSHQCLFDMCTSDDFFYFNYPALSPSSQWVQNNFKKGRRGYVLEKWNAENVVIDPFFF